MRHRELYIEAVDFVCINKTYAAWGWEDQYAKLIIEECAKIAEDANTRRIPASQYAELIRKFERLET